MKNLLFIIGLLLTFQLYCFDTLILTSKIASVQVTEFGTKVSNSVSLDVKQGSYVVKLKDIPSTVDKNHIEFTEVNGLYILNVELVKGNPIHHQDSYQDLNQEIDSVYAELKILEKNEKELLEEKRAVYDKQLSSEEFERFQDYFHAQGNAIKKERREIFKHLGSLREKNSAAVRRISQAVPKFNSTKHTLFISITLIDETIPSIQWSYLVPSKNQKRIRGKEEWVLNESQSIDEDIKLPQFVTMHGKVIEQEHRAPMIFATIEFYQDGQLFHSTSTNQNGEFSLELATRTPYDLVISFEGYRKRKIKNIFINRASIPEQIVTMKVKEKISIMEIVAYSLPILDLAKSFIK